MAWKVISLLGNHELYPYYYQGNLIRMSKFNNDYVKKVDRSEYIKEFSMRRWKYYYPGNPGAIIMGQTRPLIYQNGEFLFKFGQEKVETRKYNFGYRVK